MEIINYELRYFTHPTSASHRMSWNSDLGKCEKPSEVLRSLRKVLGTVCYNILNATDGYFLDCFFMSILASTSIG